MKIIIAKCIQCGTEKTIREGEIKKDDSPICPNCGMPMIAKKAVIK